MRRLLSIDILTIIVVITVVGGDEPVSANRSVRQSRRPPPMTRLDSDPYRQTFFSNTPSTRVESDWMHSRHQPVTPASASYHNHRPPTTAYSYKQRAEYDDRVDNFSNDYRQHQCPKIYDLPTKCRPAKDCAIWYDLLIGVGGTECQSTDGGYGWWCCPDLPVNGRGGVFKSPTGDVRLSVDVDRYSLNAAAHAGQFNVRVMDEIESQIRRNNMTVRRGSSEYTHMIFNGMTDDSAQNRSRVALLAIETSKELTQRFRLSADEAVFGLPKLTLLDTFLKATCPAELECDKSARSPFRTIDGLCNNLRNPSWGQSKTNQQRALPPAYADGVWEPRKSNNGLALPSPRLVSISVVADADHASEVNTLWTMQYGQFINHDINFTPFFRQNANGSPGFQCCTEDGQFIQDANLRHPQCLSIEIPKDDPFFARLGRRCMSFVRSVPAPRRHCQLGPAEQMDQNTHFLDHSNVYGSSSDVARQLRTFKAGALKVTPRQGHEMALLQPLFNNQTDNCTLSRNVTGVEPPANIRCFKSGDGRVNQHPDLAVAHTVFMRQHNTLAAQLAELNPHWADERLYQEARRILIAQMQHITYGEYLPVVLGRDVMQTMGLLPLTRGFSQDYDETVNPSIVNEFAVAAFRFGHSQIQGRINLMNKTRQTTSTIVLRQHFNRIQLVYTPGNVDKFLVGLAAQPSQEVENSFTEEVTNHLFEAEGAGFGLDLVSLNIQRGRDHGIQSYNAYRVLCGLPRAKHFADLLDTIPTPIVERFQLLYNKVDDVDLFIAGVSERAVPGALVGPTFQCIIADQFLRLKLGDRFFYDLGGQAGSFSEPQLEEIRKSSLARLVCDNSNVEAVQPLVFRVASAKNPLVDCKSSAIPRMSLYAWKEQPGHHVAFH